MNNERRNYPAYSQIDSESDPELQRCILVLNEAYELHNSSNITAPIAGHELPSTHESTNPSFGPDSNQLLHYDWPGSSAPGSTTGPVSRPEPPGSFQPPNPSFGHSFPGQIYQNHWLSSGVPLNTIQPLLRPESASTFQSHNPGFEHCFPELLGNYNWLSSTDQNHTAGPVTFLQTNTSLPGTYQSSYEQWLSELLVDCTKLDSAITLNATQPAARPDHPSASELPIPSFRRCFPDEDNGWLRRPAPQPIFRAKPPSSYELPNPNFRHFSPQLIQSPNTRNWRPELFKDSDNLGSFSRVAVEPIAPMADPESCYPSFQHCFPDPFNNAQAEPPGTSEMSSFRLCFPEMTDEYNRPASANIPFATYKATTSKSHTRNTIDPVARPVPPRFYERPNPSTWRPLNDSDNPGSAFSRYTVRSDVLTCNTTEPVTRPEPPRFYEPPNPSSWRPLNEQFKDSDNPGSAFSRYTVRSDAVTVARPVPPRFYEPPIASSWRPLNEQFKDSDNPGSAPSRYNVRTNALTRNTTEPVTRPEPPRFYEPPNPNSGRPLNEQFKDSDNPGSAFSRYPVKPAALTWNTTESVARPKPPGFYESSNTSVWRSFNDADSSSTVKSVAPIVRPDLPNTSESDLLSFEHNFLNLIDEYDWFDSAVPSHTSEPDARPEQPSAFKLPDLSFSNSLSDNISTKPVDPLELPSRTSPHNTSESPFPSYQRYLSELLDMLDSVDLPKTIEPVLSPELPNNSGSQICFPDLDDYDWLGLLQPFGSMNQLNTPEPAVLSEPPSHPDVSKCYNQNYQLSLPEKDNLDDPKSTDSRRPLENVVSPKHSGLIKPPSLTDTFDTAEPAPRLEPIFRPAPLSTPICQLFSPALMDDYNWPALAQPVGLTTQLNTTEPAVVSEPPSHTDASKSSSPIYLILPDKLQNANMPDSTNSRRLFEKAVSPKQPGLTKSPGLTEAPDAAEPDTTSDPSSASEQQYVTYVLGFHELLQGPDQPGSSGSDTSAKNPKPLGTFYRVAPLINYFSANSSAPASKFNTPGVSAFLGEPTSSTSSTEHITEYRRLPLNTNSKKSGIVLSLTGLVSVTEYTDADHSLILSNPAAIRSQSTRITNLERKFEIITSKPFTFCYGSEILDPVMIRFSPQTDTE